MPCDKQATSWSRAVSFVGNTALVNAESCGAKTVTWVPRLPRIASNFFEATLECWRSATNLLNPHVVFNPLSMSHSVAEQELVVLVVVVVLAEQELAALEDGKSLNKLPKISAARQAQALGYI